MWIPQTRTDPFAYIVSQFLSPNHGIYGQWTDQEVIDAGTAIRTLSDRDELIKAIKDFQNLVNKRMFVVPMVYGAAPTFVAYQPWIQNALDYQTFAQGGPTESVPHWWSNK
jgi:ABC-type transport system substrate-binding protein